MTRRSYPSDFDCVWIASDMDGRLGAFVTAGVGPIPDQALDYELIGIEQMEDAVCKLPHVSGARLVVQLKRPDDFIDLAERGFFVYDWQDCHRTTRESTNLYELMAVPLSPINAVVLPKPLRELVAVVKFEDIAFAEENAIDVRSRFSCCEHDHR
jgi:hypothetical protein